MDKQERTICDFCESIHEELCDNKNECDYRDSLIEALLPTPSGLDEVILTPEEQRIIIESVCIEWPSAVKLLKAQHEKTKAAIQDKYVLKADKAAYPKCTMCYDTGWVFEAKLDKDGNFRDGKLTLEVLPCLLPDCKVSDTPVELVSLETLKLSTVARHPKDGYVMSIAALTHRAAGE